MPDLAHIHQALVEEYHESIEVAAGRLLAQPSWTLEATVVLIHTESRAVLLSRQRGIGPTPGCCAACLRPERL
ncbi:MAG: hypothetical protein QUV06_13855 [Cyanobium sp. CZS 48M]|nr:hypothetical protein [Cyanobium sp. CZS48M]